MQYSKSFSRYLQGWYGLREQILNLSESVA